MFKKLINSYKARKEHKNRREFYNLNFNGYLNQVKHINKQILLHNLMEVTNTDPSDIVSILNLDKLIEDNRKIGVVTELYTRPTED